MKTYVKLELKPVITAIEVRLTTERTILVDPVVSDNRRDSTEYTVALDDSGHWRVIDDEDKADTLTDEMFRGTKCDGSTAKYVPTVS